MARGSTDLRTRRAVRPDDAVTHVLVLAEIHLQCQALDTRDTQVQIDRRGVATGVRGLEERLAVAEDADRGPAHSALGVLEPQPALNRSNLPPTS